MYAGFHRVLTYTDHLFSIRYLSSPGQDTGWRRLRIGLRIRSAHKDAWFQRNTIKRNTTCLCSHRCLSFYLRVSSAFLRHHALPPHFFFPFHFPRFSCRFLALSASLSVSFKSKPHACTLCLPGRQQTSYKVSTYTFS